MARFISVHPLHALFDFQINYVLKLELVSVVKMCRQIDLILGTSLFPNVKTLSITSSRFLPTLPSQGPCAHAEFENLLPPSASPFPEVKSKHNRKKGKEEILGSWGS